ncbi:adhesion G protein-coupled receptor L3-like [Magallana gigas]|uniref:adhesion G protein-coupled receptor L3-like n=1 Tax=Magallana gigas TaxID=29159 RepID=UPI003342B209
MCFSNMTEVQDCHLKSKYNFACNFSIVSNMTLKCGLSNCSNNPITSTITVVRQGDKLCESDDQWPSTQTGLNASIPCPMGYSGVVTKICRINGKWDNKNNSENCKQAKLEQIENVLSKTGKLTADIVESSLSTISSILVVNNSTSSSNENKLADNDIKQSVDLISTISTKVSFTDQEAANKTTQIFMEIVSHILGPGKNNVASRYTNAHKKEKEKKVTSKILASVNSFAKSVTSALKVNQNVTVKKHNMLLSIEKIDKNTDIKFPKETEDSSQQTTHFVLLQGAFKNMSETEVAFTAVKYENIGSEFISNNYTKVGSSVLSLTVNGLDSQYLHENITLLFQRKNVTGNSTECVFLWEHNSDTHSVWNTSGCSLENSTDSQVNCSCNHLTNFAILMSYTEEIPKEDIKRLKIISVFGCSLSIIGAFVTIVLYIYFWRYIKSRRSTLVINLCSALCIAYLLFLTAVEHSENKTGCIIIAALLHYFFLAMFTTMLCLGIDLAIAVFDVFSSRSRSAIFLLVSWGLPAVIVAITLGGSQLEGYGDESYCWLRHTTLFGFIVPVLCIVLVNLIIVIFVMRRIYTSSFMMKKSLKEKTLSGLKGVCGLLPILGLTWVFGIFSVNQDLIIFQYLFAVFNSLQGLFIFLFYVALNPQMREAVARKIKIYDSKSSISKTSKTTKFVSTSYSEEEQNFEEREDGTAASNMFIIPRCSVQNKLFNKRQ